jgi:hypothetical protein
MNKKGSIEDYTLLIVFLFVFGFLSLLAYLLYSSFSSVVATSDFYNSDIATVLSRFNTVLLMFDKIIAILMILLIISIGILNYRIRTSPVYLLVLILFSSFLGLISYFFNYLFLRMVSESVFAAVTPYFPITLIICTNLHWISLIALVVGAITLYAKGNQDGQEREVEYAE